MIFSEFNEYRFRILAGVLLVIFLVSTWFLFLQQPKYPEELHIHLQEQLKNLIENRLHGKDPNLISGLEFHNIGTEATKLEGQLKAFFEYSFIDKSKVKTVVQGTAKIYRQSLEASNDYELWILTDLQTNSTLLDFEEPVTILPSSHSSQGTGYILKKKKRDQKEKENYLEPTTAIEDDEDIDLSSWEESQSPPEEAPVEKERIMESRTDPEEILSEKTSARSTSRQEKEESDSKNQ